MLALSRLANHSAAGGTSASSRNSELFVILVTVIEVLSTRLLRPRSTVLYFIHAARGKRRLRSIGIFKCGARAVI